MTGQMDSRFHGNDKVCICFIRHFWDSLESPDTTETLSAAVC